MGKVMAKKKFKKKSERRRVTKGRGSYGAFDLRRAVAYCDLSYIEEHG